MTRVETLNPDGTATRTAYDADNRAYLTMNAFVPAIGGDSSAQGTLTTYNALGQVTQTQQMSGVDIEISIDPVTQIATATVVSRGTQVSSTSSVYNAQGQKQFITTLTWSQQYEIGLRIWQSAMYGSIDSAVVKKFIGG